jgi:tetratricopeptide (TPR) repeat protein
MFSDIIGFILILFFDFPMVRIEQMFILIVLFAIVIQQYGIKFGHGFTYPKSKKIVLLFIVSGAFFSLIVTFDRFAAEKQVCQLYASRATDNAAEQLFFIRQAEGFFYTIDSKKIPLEWYKGVAQFSKQQYVESKISFESAYILSPYNIHVINNLACCYEVNGKRKEAMKLYKKALQIFPRFEEGRLNLTAVYFNNKDYEKAFQTIDSCSIETRDEKYKIFLSPILKSKASMLISAINFPVSAESTHTLTNVQDYSNLFYQSKKNNITFEQQIINHLKK